MAEYRYGGYSSCASPFCNNTGITNAEVSYFRFPKDWQRCLIWISNCGLKESKETSQENWYKNYRLCSAHFEASTFSSLLKNRLKRTAVPTLFGDLNSGASCQTQRSSTATLALPMVTQESASCLSDITKIRDKTLLCGAHFTEDDYSPCNGQKRLDKKAIPLIFKVYRQPVEKLFVIRRSTQCSQSNPQGLLGDKTAEFHEGIPKIEADVDPLETETAVCVDQENRLIEFVDVQRHSETRNQENNQQHKKLMSIQSLKQYNTALERENCKLRAQLTRVNRLRRFAKTLCLENKRLKQKLMRTRQRLKARRLLRNSVANIKRETF